MSESELAFRDEARAWLAANVPAEPLPSMDTAEGFARAPGVGGEARRRPLVGRLVARGVPRSRGVAGRVGDLRGGVLPRRRTGPGLPERHLPARADHLRPRHPGAAGPLPADDGHRRADLGAGWSEPEAGSDLASLRSTARRDDERGGWVLNGQKTWSSRATYAHWGFGLFRSDPEAAAARRADLLPVPARRRRASPSGRSPSSTARPASPRSSSTTCSCPTPTCSARPGDGWRVAMSTAGNERGLSLRSPGRFCAAADRLVELYATRVEHPDELRRPASSTPGSRRRPTGSTPGAPSPGSPTAARWAPPARSTRCSGPSSTSRCTRPRSTCSGPTAELESTWSDGYLFSLSGPIYAGTNEIQRNIVAERILGLPREPKGARSMRFELTDEQRDFAVRARATAGARRHRGASPGPGRTATTSPGLKLWERLADQGADRAGHRGHRRSRSCIAFEALGRHAVPGPGSSPPPTCRSLLGREVDGRRHGRRPPHAPYALDADVADTVCSSPAARLHAGRRSASVHGSVDPTRRLFDGRPPGEWSSRRTRPCDRGLRPGRAGARPSCSGRRADARRLGRPT